MVVGCAEDPMQLFLESGKDIRTREHVVQHPESDRDGVC